MTRVKTSVETGFSTGRGCLPEVPVPERQVGLPVAPPGHELEQVRQVAALLHPDSQFAMQ